MDEGRAVYLWPSRCVDHSEIVPPERLSSPDYVPQRLSLLQAGDTPSTNQETPLPEHLRFPLPYPIGGLLQRYLEGDQQSWPTVRIKLRGHPVATSQSAVTHTPDKVANLSVQFRLHQVRKCSGFWENAERYTYEQEPTHNTFESNTTLATGSQQLAAAYQLQALFGKFAVQKAPLVNGEPAVQDVIRTQLLDFADALLQSRYRNSILNAGQQGAPIADTYLPMWGRAIAKNHTKPTDGRKKAGFPDFVLFPSTVQYEHAAIMEVKTWWSYSMRILHNIFSPEALTNIRSDVGIRFPVQGGGFFKWKSPSVSAKLLRQIWGQLHFFRVDWGAWSNGEEIVLFVITDKYDSGVPGSCNQLTFSDPINLTATNDVPYGFSGFCFASLDSNASFNPNGPEAQAIKNFICPQDERLNPIAGP